MARTETATARRWAITEKARNIHRVSIEFDRVGDECWVLLQSDVHWDNPKCDRTAYKRHLDDARARGALVLDGGDFFCAMQGKWDKRGELWRSQTHKYRPLGTNERVLAPGAALRARTIAQREM